MIIIFQELLILDDFDIDIYTNKIVQDNYDRFIFLLKEHHLSPDRTNMLLDGGVSFFFKRADVSIYFEIYNDG